MENQFYLYAIIVDSSYIWGELPVHEGNGYEIHAIPVVENAPEEDVVSNYIWGLQCEAAESQAYIKSFCSHCDEEEGDCECEESDFLEEDYSEFVERHSYYRAVKYDPLNKDHICCPGAENYRDLSLKHKIERQERIDYLAHQVRSDYACIETLSAKLEEAKARLEVDVDKLMKLVKENEAQND